MYGHGPSRTWSLPFWNPRHFFGVVLPCCSVTGATGLLLNDLLNVGETEGLEVDWFLTNLLLLKFTLEKSHYHNDK